MARGFLIGMGAGGIVSAVGAVLVSVLVPMRPAPDVADHVALPEAQGVAATVASPSSLPDTDTGATQPGGPAEPASRGDLSGLDAADMAPGARPEVAALEGALNGPVAGGGDAPAVRAATDAPVAPGAAGTAPAAPRVETEASISVEPAQPEAPAPDGNSGFGTGTAAAPEPAVVSPDADSPVLATAPQPIPESAPAQSAAVAEPAPAAPPVAAEPAPPAVAEPAPPVAAEPVQPAPAQTAEPAEAAPARPGTPVVPLTDRAPARLATVGGAAADPAAGAATDPAASADLAPIDRFAASFENPQDLPVMAIVLIDDAASIGAEALAAFPYPLSFAVDPAAPGAAEKMARHRAAGFEVLAVVDLPQAGTPGDAEVGLEAGLAALPEAVAVLEGTGTGIQGNRPMSDQVTAILRQTGHGLVTQDNGLNTVQKLALREGVPSAVVFRDFDGAGQNPSAMRRFLDQAAFRARQEGAVIMLGRLRPDTISALLLWGLQDRASQVALAPVSAVLKAGLDG